MPKTKINKKIYERSLLTEFAPFETPLLYSNWGSFNYEYKLRKEGNKLLDELFKPNKILIPYTYRINKDLNDYRTLHIPHPSASRMLVDLYKKYDVMIPKLCAKSPYSIRAPHNIAKWFLFEKSNKKYDKYVEQIDENKSYSSSYFVYKHFSHLYKFFESKQFTTLENKYTTMVRLDITKFFPSIYTHSITWALRGKNEAKKMIFDNRDDEKSFPRSFDCLMQAINHKETNGIIIGPELSRIFSEIILQSIDCSLEKTLKEDCKYYNDSEYFCCRYIDDYYLFYNEEKVFEEFEKKLKIELEKYKLYLNSTKKEIIRKPFITEASLLKIELSKYLTDLSNRLKEKKRIRSEKELNKLRAIIGQQKDSLYKVTSFFLGSLCKTFKYSIKLNNDVEYLVDIYLVFIELSMHWFKLDMRVSGSYKIVDLINDIIVRIKKLPPDSISKIKSTMYYELTDALNIACTKKSIIEILNLLICLKRLGNGYELSSEKISLIIDKSRIKSMEDEKEEDRNTYFDIVTLVYYIENKPQYNDNKTKLLHEILSIMAKNDIKKYSETMMLFLDIISCPFIEIDFKKEIIKTISIKLNIRHTISDINFYYNMISSQSWYFNWKHGDDIRKMLKKKQYMLSY